MQLVRSKNGKLHSPRCQWIDGEVERDPIKIDSEELEKKDNVCEYCLG